MDNNSRINQTSISATTPRQTPQNDFGQVMARTLSGAVQVGASVAGGLTMGNPVLSAAVSSVAAVASQAVSSKSSAVTSVGGTAPGTVGGGTGTGSTGGVGTGSTGAANGNEFDLLEAQKLMQSDERKFNLEYLNLQNAMQRESREFNAVSNIMKVRHDSAKAAINNIR